MTRRLLLVAVIVPVLVYLLSRLNLSCEPDEPDDVPGYHSTISAPGQVDVVTDVADPGDLREVFDDVRDARTEGNSWRVTITCAMVPEGSDDAVLATGRFANTQQGLAETGLADIDDARFETTGRPCVPGRSTVAGAVTPDQVIEAVEAAGLGAPNPRDSSNFCSELGCVEHTTTDAFTVTVWPSRQEAAQWAEGTPLEVVRVGPVTTVEFQQGERAFPYPDDPTVDAYVAALEPLQG
jgi:hypothetical protein